MVSQNWVWELGFFLTINHQVDLDILKQLNSRAMRRLLWFDKKLPSMKSANAFLLDMTQTETVQSHSRISNALR